jgi:hypothetical protein
MKKFILGLVLIASLAACGGGGGTPTTNANLTFSNATGGYNGSLEPITSNVTVVNLIVTTTQGSGAGKRVFGVSLPQNSRDEGVTYVIKNVTNASLNYSEGDSSPAKIWSVTGGSIKVVRKSGKTLIFELIGVTLGKLAGDTGPSLGSVTVNGTIGGESITPLQ